MEDKKESRKRKSTEMVAWHWWYTVSIVLLCLLAGIGIRSVQSGRASQKFSPRVDGFRVTRGNFESVIYTVYATPHEITDLGERLEARQNQFMLVCVWDKSIDPASTKALELKDRISQIAGVTKVFVWKYGVGIWKYSPSIEETEPQIRLYDWNKVWKNTRPLVEEFFKKK